MSGSRRGGQVGRPRKLLQARMAKAMVSFSLLSMPSLADVRSSAGSSAFRSANSSSDKRIRSNVANVEHAVAALMPCLTGSCYRSFHYIPLIAASAL